MYKYLFYVRLFEQGLQNVANDKLISRKVFGCAKLKKILDVLCTMYILDVLYAILCAFSIATHIVSVFQDFNNTVRVSINVTGS